MRPDGVRDTVTILLIAYCKKSGKIELHHWRQDPMTGWQHVSELRDRG
jgi:hypothetical protein